MSMRVRNLNGAYEISVRDGFGDDDGVEYELPKRQFFRTQEEMTKAMSRPEYKKSASYRQVVKTMLSQSDPVALGLAPAPANDRAEYDLQRQAMARELFKDPRYKSDARYRAHVQEMISSPEADVYFPELSQEQVDRKNMLAKGLRVEVEPKNITGPINPNAKRDPEGNVK